MTTKTSLWADRVVRDRQAALDAAGTRAPRGLRPRRDPARPRTASRLSALRLTPVVAAATTLAVGVFAGTAYAYFSATGSGTGSASVGRLQGVHVEPATATVTSPLFPGATGTLVLSLTNPNAISVSVVGVAQDGPVTVTTTSGGGAGCTSDTGTWPSITPGTSGVSVTAGVQSGLDLPLAANAVTTVTVGGGATMSTSSNTTCQGASFHIPVTVTVRS